MHLLACTATAKERVRIHNHLRDATAAFAKAVVGEGKVAMEQTLTHAGMLAIRMDLIIELSNGRMESHAAATTFFSPANDCWEASRVMSV